MGERRGGEEREWEKGGGGGEEREWDIGEEKLCRLWRGREEWGGEETSLGWGERGRKGG